MQSNFKPQLSSRNLTSYSRGIQPDCPIVGTGFPHPSPIIGVVSQPRLSSAPAVRKVYSTRNPKKNKAPAGRHFNSLNQDLQDW